MSVTMVVFEFVAAAATVIRCIQTFRLQNVKTLKNMKKMSLFYLILEQGTQVWYFVQIEK